ncbi:MAG: PspA/IM30 family protein [Actinomycetia bacterium]|nr:PspA/IM30 family protein [Actinomycetes bacterium]
MGLMARMSTIFKAKVSKVLDQVEDPRETLEYSYQRQLEQLQQVRRGVADVVTSKKRIELQAARLQEQVQKWEEDARTALAQGREDLAREALTRRETARQQLEGLHAQIADLEKEEAKLVTLEQKLSAKVEAFRTQKEVIKAKYSAAEAQVKIGEAASGLSEEMADVGLAMQRAQDKTEAMQARAQAIDELLANGTLEDPTTTGDRLQDELNRVKAGQNIEAELARLKQEVGGASP